MSGVLRRLVRHSPSNCRAQQVWDLMVSVTQNWKQAVKVMTQTEEPIGTPSSLSDGSVSVVPGPPQELDPRDVVRSVDHLPHEAGEADGGEEGEAEPPGGHGAAVHEHDVHTGDVEGHPRGQHDAGLGLPEVVHDGKDHEESIICSAGTEGGHPDKQVSPAVAGRMNEGHHSQEYEVELSYHKGGQHHEPLGGVGPVTPGQTLPLWIGFKHFL